MSAAAAALILLFAVLALSGCAANKTADDSDSADQQSGQPAAQSPAVVDNEWSMVTLVDGTQVFGQRTSASTAEYVVLDRAFFIAGEDTTDVNTLRPFGTEVHRPEQMLVVPVTSVVYREPLMAEAPAVAAMSSYLQSNPTTATPEPDMSGAGYWAVFMRTGEVFFGRLSSEGGSVRLTGAHFLRFKDDAAADAGDIKSLDQVELIPEAQAAAGSTGDMYIPLESALYLQPLRVDSPVVAALAATP